MAYKDIVPTHIPQINVMTDIYHSCPLELSSNVCISVKKKQGISYESIIQGVPKICIHTLNDYNSL